MTDSRYQPPRGGDVPAPTVPPTSADSARLDWLERVRPTVSYHWRGDEGRQELDRVVFGGTDELDELFRDWDKELHEIAGKPRTLRAAIDAAMATATQRAAEEGR